MTSPTVVPCIKLPVIFYKKNVRTVHLFVFRGSGKTRKPNKKKQVPTTHYRISFTIQIHVMSVAALPCFHLKFTRFLIQGTSQHVFKIVVLHCLTNIMKKFHPARDAKGMFGSFYGFPVKMGG